jgi:hypothetical protein
MKTQAKTWFIISGTFLLGLIVGILGSHLFFRYQVGRIVDVRSPQRIFGFMDRIVQPTAEQRPEFEKILQRHGQLLIEQMRENQSRQQQRLSDLKADLAAILTPTQMDRLEDHLQRRSQRLRPGRGRRNPTERHRRPGQGKGNV